MERSMMVNWNDNEKELYAKSRALKMQARELRKYRLEREAIAKADAERKAKAEALAKRQAYELKANEAKTDRDNRIRKALLAMTDQFKTNGIKMEAPDVWSVKKPCFRVYDSKTLQWVQIYAQHNGFQWD